MNNVCIIVINFSFNLNAILVNASFSDEELKISGGYDFTNISQRLSFLIDWNSLLKVQKFNHCLRDFLYILWFVLSCMESSSFYLVSHGSPKRHLSFKNTFSCYFVLDKWVLSRPFWEFSVIYSWNFFFYFSVSFKVFWDFDYRSTTSHLPFRKYSSR